MTDAYDVGRDPQALANARLAEIEELFAEIRETIQLMKRASDGAPELLGQAIKKMDQLTKAHLTVLTAEDAFHAKFGYRDDALTIDFEAMRAEIGCQLDRIRASLDAEGVFIRPAR